MNLTRPRDSDSACWRWRLKNMYNLNIFFRWVIWWEWENFTLSLFDFGHNFYYKTVFLAQTLLLILKACVSNCLDMSLIGRFISISNFLCVKWNPSLSFSHHLLSASFLVWQVAPPSSQLLSLQPGTDMISLSLTSYVIVSLLSNLWFMRKQGQILDSEWESLAFPSGFVLTSYESSTS